EALAAVAGVSQVVHAVDVGEHHEAQLLEAPEARDQGLPRQRDAYHPLELPHLPAEGRQGLDARALQRGGLGRAVRGVQDATHQRDQPSTMGRATPRSSNASPLTFFWSCCTA